MNNTQINYIIEDEIDLKELWHIIIIYKKFIIIFVSIITIVSLIYVYFKNPIPIYTGNMMIEIGEVKNNNPKQIYFDNAYTLKNILEKKFDIEIKIPKKANSINNSNNILTIIANNKDKIEIQKKLTNIYLYIKIRHKEKIKLYDNYIMTKKIGKIVIVNEPINKPKKKLIVIVSFITALILSIFIVFFLDFLKKEEN